MGEKPHMISTPKGTGGLGAVPLTLSIDDSDYQKTLNQVKCTTVDFGVNYRFCGSLQIGDLRLKDSSLPPTFCIHHGDGVDGQLQRQQQKQQ